MAHEPEKGEEHDKNFKFQISNFKFQKWLDIPVLNTSSVEQRAQQSAGHLSVQLSGKMQLVRVNMAKKVEENPQNMLINFGKSKKSKECTEF